jgi:hypothetical protein
LAATQLRHLAYDGIWQYWTEHGQHRLLTRLATRYPTTYYVAPRFGTQAELHERFARRRLLVSSLISRVETFPGPRTDNQHRHRVISPCAAPSSIFVFSEVAVLENIDWRKEMTKLAASWPTEPPLALQVSELWKELPGSQRTKDRALTSAKRILASQERVPPLQTEGRQARSLIDRETDSTRRRTTPRKESIRPWTGNIRPAAIEVELGGRTELLAKLIVISDVLGRRNVQLAVTQPSDRAL